jgi:hypothetical protein
MTGKIIDEKFLSWKRKEFLERRISLRRPHINLQVLKKKKP